jgi:hypothetical protein
MSIETPGDSSNLGHVFTGILGDLESKQLQGSKDKLFNYLEEKLTDLVVSRFLSEDDKDYLQARLVSLKDKQIKQLEPKDFIFVKSLFNKAIRDSGCEDYLEPRSSLIQNGIKILKYGLCQGPFECQVHECANEMPDAPLKAKFVKFCIEHSVDLTSNIRELPPKTFQKMLKFLENLEKEVKKYEDQEGLNKKSCVEFLSSVGLSPDQIAALAEQEKILQRQLETNRPSFKQSAITSFRSDLLTPGANDAEAIAALNPSERIEVEGQQVHVCTQAWKDFFDGAPRTLHTLVRTPYMSLMRVDSRAKAQELYKQLELLADKMHPQAAPEEKNRLLNILLFFCSQHPSNGFLPYTRQVISEFLADTDDRFSLVNDDLEIKLSPVVVNEEIVPNQFFLVYDATLSVRPQISLEDLGSEDKKIAKQALDKVGLGSCFTTKVSATMRVDCSTVNPTVDVNSFDIV